MTAASPRRVLHTVRSLRVDGIVRVVQRTVGALDPAEFTSTVAAIRPGATLAGEFSAAGFEPRMVGHRGPRHALRTVARLVRLIRRERIELVHTNQTLDLLLAGTAARLCGVPVVASIHWLGDFERFAPRDSWAREARRARARLLADRALASRIVVVSDAVLQAQLRIHGTHFPEWKTRVVYPGLATRTTQVDDAAGTRIRAELGLSATTPVVLNVGRLHPVKGQRHLIPMMERVVSAHPDAVLLVAGDGPLREELQRLAATSLCPRSIRFLGSRADVDDLLAAALVLVMTSESEAAPLPLMEAGRAARPAIATAVGGSPEIIRDGETGFVVGRGDVDALARRVIQLLNDPEEARLLGDAARRRVEAEFDIGVVTERLADVYRELLQPGTPPL